MKRAYTAGLVQGILQTVQIFKFNISEALGFLIPILDYLYRLDLHKA
jgi:hypothetical protein